AGGDAGGRSGGPHLRGPLLSPGPPAGGLLGRARPLWDLRLAPADAAPDPGRPLRPPPARAGRNPRAGLGGGSERADLPLSPAAGPAGRAHRGRPDPGERHRRPPEPRYGPAGPRPGAPPGPRQRPAPGPPLGALVPRRRRSLLLPDLPKPDRPQE